MKAMLIPSYHLPNPFIAYKEEFILGNLSTYFLLHSFIISSVIAHISTSCTIVLSLLSSESIYDMQQLKDHDKWRCNKNSTFLNTWIKKKNIKQPSDRNTDNEYPNYATNKEMTIFIKENK